MLSEFSQFKHIFLQIGEKMADNPIKVGLHKVAEKVKSRATNPDVLVGSGFLLLKKIGFRSGKNIQI